jgi:hypothetical protein
MPWILSGLNPFNVTIQVEVCFIGEHVAETPGFSHSGAQYVLAEAQRLAIPSSGSGTLTFILHGNNNSSQQIFHAELSCCAKRHL